MNRQTFFRATALCCLLAALLFLYLLNNIVHEVLYDFGLVFNEIWAVPYWNWLNITTALIIASLLFIAISIRRPKPETSLSRLPDLEKPQKQTAKLSQKRKTYNHTLCFKSLLDAENFEETLKKRCPVIEAKLKILDDRPILTFRMFEPIEDLEDFAEIVDFTIVEEEN